MSPCTRLRALAFSSVVLGACSRPSEPINGGPSAGGWRSASLGLFHTCAISGADGKTSCWGSNQYGALGDAHARDSTCTANGFRVACRMTPMPIASDPSFVTLSSNGFNTCGLTAGGTAYCWGSGGVLGPGRDSSAVPVKVQSFATFSTIAVGSFHFACALSPASGALCWGDNSQGQLGNGTRVPSDTPFVLPNAPRFNTVTSGGSHVCGLTVDGTAYCWGDNSSGELGLGTADSSRVTPTPVATTQRFMAIDAAFGRTCALTTAGHVWCWGGVYNLAFQDSLHAVTPTPILSGLTFTNLSVGRDVSCALTAAGAVYCWDDYALGGHGDRITPTGGSAQPVIGGHAFSAIAVGDYHSCGITSNGDMYCWGWAHDGQLGTAGFSNICFGSDDYYQCTGTPQLVKKP